MTDGTNRSASLPDVDDLTLDQQIGQMLCLGWGGPEALLNLNAQAREAVEEIGAGGMVVMGRNLQPQMRPLPPIDAAGVRAMLAELQSLAAIPLLIATDQEGGRVARFGSAPFTPMPSARQVGATGDLELAKAAAWATGRELAAVGVNWDFAPDADVDSNPANPVIGDRSFATTASEVAAMTVAQTQGCAEGGVLACAKHFPGHGDTLLDSHLALPTLPFDREAMEARELVPFRAAIDAGIPSLMTAHILFPAMAEDKLPATLSRSILTGLLRESLGFDGLIVTDDLEMKAVLEQWGTPRAAVLAACAGADMLLICHTPERQREAFVALKQAAQTGELPRERVRDAARRVLAAKQKVAAFPPRPDLSVIGCAEHEAIRRALSGEDTRESAPTTLGAEAPK